MTNLIGKTCFKCGEFKEYSEFYKHSKMPDGLLNKCKECAKSDARQNRADNIEYYREYDRIRNNSENRIIAREKYQKTENGIASSRKAKIKWILNNVIKRAAHHMVNNCVRDKKIIKPNICESCGQVDNRLHGHHDDYAKPLEVRWLCAQCHRDWHKQNGEALNSN